jgi:tetratricopeptide (TPR) repeat protein
MSSLDPKESAFSPQWLRRLTPKAAILGSAVGAALFSLFCFTPRFWLWPGLHLPRADLLSLEPEFHRAFFALQQLDNPWLKIDDPTNRVIEWRLFWPTIAHCLHLPEKVYLALPMVGALVSLGAIAALVWRVTQQPLATISAAVFAATSSWFFVSAGWLAYFDSWLVFALLGASFLTSRRTLFAIALFAPWVDERFILSLPLCLGVRSLGADGVARDRHGLLRDAGALLGGIAPYLAIRLGAEFSHARETSTAYWSQRSLLPAPPAGMLYGLWQGLRLGWMPVIAVAALFFRQKETRPALVLIVASIVVNLCIADDLSRSASIALPVLVAGVLLVWRQATIFKPGALLLFSAGNLLLPAVHVIATPTRETEAWHSVPLLYLYAEVDHARNPPDYASPATYNERGFAAFNAGDTERALRNFEISLGFNPGFAKAHANRGIILFLSGQQAAGLAELTRTVREHPGMYDARLQLAGLHFQLGDLASALAEVRTVLHDAPANWNKQADAVTLEQNIRAKLPTPH